MIQAPWVGKTPEEYAETYTLYGYKEEYNEDYDDECNEDCDEE